MNADSNTDSRPQGESAESDATIDPRSLLAGLSGSWKGVTRTWLDPSGEPEETSSSARVIPIFDGRLIEISYQSTLQDRPLEGRMTYAFDDRRRTITRAWIDTLHNGSLMMISTGTWDGEPQIVVTGTYPWEDTTWGWRTEIRDIQDDQFTIMAYNISPEGQEDPAIETRYSRSGD